MVVFLLSLLIGSVLALQGGVLLTAVGAGFFFSGLIITVLLTQVGAWDVFWAILFDILAFNLGFVAGLGVRISFSGFWRS